ncbi:MAG: Dabb family protein [Cytophagaceae bacterium]|nr:Dabb family protein [Cytophagaceae bacterium]MBK9935770.1 Dabb family protein [Cytophagaceae bacterium]MBL0302203.1 Dabb family protein [Cytophagaceae bacterium]MBL0325029.1 Dabb family protein [Cytophagaceae bacterium]
MKKLALILIAILGIMGTASAQKKELRHVVMFKFKEGTSATDIKKVEDAFRELPNKIKEIKGYEWGINNSPEKLDNGFTHVFLLTFDSEEGRSAYLPHPDHKAFGKVLGPFLDKVMVLDYWAGK